MIVSGTLYQWDTGTLATQSVAIPNQTGTNQALLVNGAKTTAFVCQSVNSGKNITKIDLGSFTVTSQSATVSGGFSSAKACLDTSGNIWSQDNAFSSNNGAICKYDPTTFAQILDVPIQTSAGTGAVFTLPTGSGIVIVISVVIYNDGANDHILVTGRQSPGGVNSAIMVSLSTSGTVEWRSGLIQNTGATALGGGTFCPAIDGSGNKYVCSGSTSGLYPWFVWKIDGSGAVTRFSFNSDVGHGIPTNILFESTSGHVYCFTDDGTSFVVSTAGSLLNTYGSVASPLYDTTGQGAAPYLDPPLQSAVVATNYQSLSDGSILLYNASVNTSPNVPVLSLYDNTITATTSYNLTTFLPSVTYVNRGSFRFYFSSAPITLVELTGGNFQDFLGTPLANGYLILRLDTRVEILGSSKVIPGGIHEKILLDASGSVITSPAQRVYATDALSPTCLYSVRAFKSDGTNAWGPWAVPVISSVGGTYDVGQWIPIFTSATY